MMYNHLEEYEGYRVGDLVEITACDIKQILIYHMRGKNANRIYRNTKMDKFQITGWFMNTYGQVVGVFLKYVYHHKKSPLKFHQQPFYFYQIKFAKRMQGDETLWSYYQKNRDQFHPTPKMINFTEILDEDIK